MLTAWLLVLCGLALLVLGGDALVRGASGLALLARLRPAVIGLTVVAAGTSMPELVVSVQSALGGIYGIAIGNVVGSNIFNIGAILGITAIVRPLVINSQSVRLEWPVMFLAAFQLHLLSRDGTLDRLEGGYFLCAMVAFTAYAIMVGRSDATLDAEESENLTTASFGRSGSAAVLFNALAIAGGVGLLAGGASLLVKGATVIASAAGLSETVIGLTIVSAGTSMPELITSLVAAYRGKDDIAIGNVLGSNIFNVFGIAGATAAIHPLSIPGQVIAQDNLWMMGLSLLLLPLMWTGMRVNRIEGLGLLATFTVYLFILLYNG